MIDDLKIEAKKLHKLSKVAKDKRLKELSFEFVVGSLFPQALKNIKEEMDRLYYKKHNLSNSNYIPFLY